MLSLSCLLVTVTQTLTDTARLPVLGTGPRVWPVGALESGGNRDQDPSSQGRREFPGVLHIAWKSLPELPCCRNPPAESNPGPSSKSLTSTVWGDPRPGGSVPPSAELPRLPSSDALVLPARGRRPPRPFPGRHVIHFLTVTRTAIPGHCQGQFPRTLHRPPGSPESTPRRPGP